ncbi:MAG: fumarylacetoacetate hydrolase family protein [Thermoprotei archaeon]
MRFLTFKLPHDYKIRYGIVVDENLVIDLEKLLTKALIEEYDLDPQNAYEVSSSIFTQKSKYVIQRVLVFKDLIAKQLKKISKAEDTRRELAYSMDEIKFLPPIFDPGKIVGIGLNFEEYRIMLKYPKPEVPLFFFKPPSTLIGHKDYVIIPRGGKWPGTSSKVLFHEYELALVIGKRAKNIERRDALNYVFGFTVFSDITAHDIEMIKPGFVLYQQRSKAFDTFSPMGPWIVTVDELLEKGVDVHNLRMCRRRNGVVEGESNTKNMIFKVEEILEFLSEIMVLEPGDIISLGSPPAGPPEGLQPGDVIEAEIEHIGTLINYVK